MYLKALEIYGFKSFPEKTRLVFEKPISAIVGPNGSGKSNIADAVRWAMGEQSSKSLRGGKMEDIIFGGTEKRNQMGFAEVSMIFDNSENIFDIEASEVMVTRRYYRSGESEYYINKKVVRLKDVNELFMDTGLGREGYSIIGQGKIDEILSVKSTDRREIFEEAAGISRYRHRKDEAERKLQRADENLVRVNDKISELELQVNPLRKQAETANKYLILRDELRGLEISLWMHNLDNLGIQSEKLKNAYNIAALKTENMRRNIESLYAKNEQILNDVKAKELEVENDRVLASAAETAIAETERAVAVLRTNLQNNVESVKRIESEIEQSEGRDDGLAGQIRERRERLLLINNEKETALKRVDELNTKSDELDSDSAVVEDELNILLKKENTLSASIAAEKAKISSAAESLQEAEDRGSTIIIELNEASRRFAEAKMKSEKASKALVEAKNNVVSSKNMISGYSMRVNNRCKKFNEEQEKSIKLSMEQNSLKSRISMLQEMEKEYQGYSKAVKFVMQESSRGVLKNIYGTVAELVKTSDKYAVAIEIALGGALQNIITATENDAKMAINTLKRRDIGRATFIPVSSTRGQRLNVRGIETENGFEGIASDLVKFDRQFEEIYINLLGRTVITSNLDDAVKIARKYGYRFKIVTLDGQVVNAGGSMTGGSISRNTGILSRANEIERLTSQIKELEESAEKSANILNELQRELTAAEYELSTASEELRSAEDKVLRLEGEKAQCELLCKTAEEYKATLDNESKLLKTRIDNNENIIAGSKALVIEIEQELKAIKEQTDRLSNGREEITEKKRDIISKVSDLRAEIASLDAEKEAVAKSMKELDELRIDLSVGKNQKENMLVNIKAQNQKLALEIEEKESSVKNGRATSEKYKEDIMRLNREKLELEGNRTRLDKEIQDSNRMLLDFEREVSRAEQRRLAAEMEEKQILDKLWDTYELSRSAAMLVKMELDNIQETSHRISELRREISKLGTPNIGAIEEFKRVNERYTYLTEQRDDIEKSKTELNKIINELTMEMKNIFAREFNVINESFKETFIELFGGGKASLELEDENDILNCGIEIKVQPPGKSLKTISLLSGGEKAFVASALYFSIIKVKPTPFVVMDEIEAALDDVNVMKFAAYLRRLTDKTQFIVITHKRNTMEEADVLYGVTMQEKGVSRVLMVDLEEAGRAILED